MPSGSHQIIPEREERLCEVSLHTPRLVMNIVIMGIIGRQFFERVPGDVVSAMIVDSLHGRQSKEDHCLSSAHARDEVGKARAESITDKTLKRMIVKRTVGIRGLQAVMTTVKIAVAPFRGVHQAMQEVLPRIDDGNRDSKLYHRVEDMVDDSG